jgi:hypothetical protein
MSKPMNPDPYDEAPPDADEADCAVDDWSLDEFDDAADLTTLRSAWMGSHDRFE